MILTEKQATAPWQSMPVPPGRMDHDAALKILETRLQVLMVLLFRPSDHDLRFLSLTPFSLFRFPLEILLE